MPIPPETEEKIKEIIEYIPEDDLGHVLLDLARGKVDALREVLDKACPDKIKENSTKIQFISELPSTFGHIDILKNLAIIAQEQLFCAPQQKAPLWNKLHTLLKSLVDLNEIIELPTLHIAYEPTKEEPQIKEYSYRLMSNTADDLEERELGFYVVANEVVVKLRDKIDFSIPESNEIYKIIIEANKREGAKSFTVEEIQLLSQNTLLNSHIQKEQLKKKLKLAVTDVVTNCCAVLYKSWHKIEWGEFIGLSIDPEKVDVKDYGNSDTDTIQLHLRYQPIFAKYQSLDGKEHTIQVGTCNFEAQYNSKVPKQTITISKLTFELTKEYKEKEGDTQAELHSSLRATNPHDIPLVSPTNVSKEPKSFKTLYSAIVSNLTDIKKVSKRYKPIKTFKAILPDTLTKFSSIFENIQGPADKLNFLLTILGNDKAGTFTEELLESKEMWQILQQPQLNSDNVLRITYIIAENLQEALKQQVKDKKAITNLKRALKYLRKNKKFTDIIVNNVENIKHIENILRNDPYGIFLPALFSSKQITEIKKVSTSSDWIKLREPLEENLSAAEERLRKPEILENLWLDKHAIRHIVPILYDHFQNPDKTKIKWIDQYPRLSYLFRPLIGFFRTLWKTIISGNKKAPYVIDENNKEKGKIILGAMPPFVKLRNLVKENEQEGEKKEIILISYQAPEETYTRSGKSLNDAISGSTNTAFVDRAKYEYTHKVTRKSRPLFDHSCIETTTGKPVDPRKAMNWLNEDAADYENGAIIRINCKSGIERSNVMTALLCSRVTDMPLLGAFDLVNKKRPSTLPFDKLNSDLQQLAINAYFLMLQEDASRLENFLQQTPEVIDKHIEAFLQANLNLKKAKQNCKELSEHVKNIDKNTLKAFLSFMATINDKQIRINCKSGIGRRAVMIALLCSQATDTPLFEAFKSENNKLLGTPSFDELNPNLQRLAINTYFLMLKENPPHLAKFLQQSPEVIGKYIETFLQANLNLKNAETQNWDELEKNIEGVDKNISEAFVSVITAINEHRLWLVPMQESKEATTQYIAVQQPKAPNIIPIVQLKKPSGFSVDYYAYGPDKELHNIKKYQCIDNVYPLLANSFSSDESPKPMLLTIKIDAKEGDINSFNTEIYKTIMVEGGYAQLSMLDKGYAMSQKAQIALDYYCANNQQKILVQALHLISNLSSNVKEINIAVTKLNELKKSLPSTCSAARSIELAIDDIKTNNIDKALKELRIAIANAVTPPTQITLPKSSTQRPSSRVIPRGSSSVDILGKMEELPINAELSFSQASVSKSAAIAIAYQPDDEVDSASSLSPTILFPRC